MSCSLRGKVGLWFPFLRFSENGNTFFVNIRCLRFSLQGKVRETVTLDFEITAASADIESMATKEDVLPIERQLSRLVNRLRMVHQDIVDLSALQDEDHQNDRKYFCVDAFQLSLCEMGVPRQGSAYLEESSSFWCAHPVAFFCRAVITPNIELGG